MKPPQWNELSPDIQNKFLMNGRVRLENWYFDDEKTWAAAKRHYSKEDIDALIEKAKTKKQGDAYGITDEWLYECLEVYPLKGLSVAIMGSTIPWYESIVLANGGTPTIFEYNLMDYNHPDIKQIMIKDYEPSGQFDMGISISSFEHDGLGRYGDPINPDGDLRAMKEMKKILKKDGILFLAVPTGMDKVVWNAHRIYGNARLPLLLEGWEPIGSAGVQDNLIETDTGSAGSYQPVIVLQNV